MIRAYVVSAVCLYREGLCESLERREGVEVVGAAADVAVGTAEIRRLASPPDVVLLDMSGPAGVEAARQLLDVLPAVCVLAISVPDNEPDVIACAETGLSGFLTIESSIDDLVAALEVAARGDLLCSPAMAAALLRRVSALARSRESSDPASALTLRELEIVRLIDEGQSNKQIAQRLCIELSTVKNHVHNILGKLGVQRRSEAAARVRARTPQLARMD
jgi:two-component system nitrate/nitrite response regulator NarL